MHCNNYWKHSLSGLVKTISILNFRNIIHVKYWAPNTKIFHRNNVSKAMYSQREKLRLLFRLKWTKRRWKLIRGKIKYKHKYNRYKIYEEKKEIKRMLHISQKKYARKQEDTQDSGMFSGVLSLFRACVFPKPIKHTRKEKTQYAWIIVVVFFCQLSFYLSCIYYWFLACFHTLFLWFY